LNKINENWDQIEYKPRDTTTCHNAHLTHGKIFKIKKNLNLKKKFKNFKKPQSDMWQLHFTSVNDLNGVCKKDQINHKSQKLGPF